MDNSGTPLPPAAIAVTSKGYSDPGAMLSKYAPNLKYEEIKWGRLHEPDLLQFDALLISSSLHCVDAIRMPNVLERLRGFVEKGGLLWGEDWALPLLCEAFPKQLRPAEKRGDAQIVKAQILDAELIACLDQRECTLTFKFDNWQLLDKTGGVDSNCFCLTGNIIAEEQRLPSMPLLVSFPYGSQGGWVIAGSMGLEAFPEECREGVFFHLLRHGALKDRIPAQAPAPAHAHAHVTPTSSASQAPPSPSAAITPTPVFVLEYTFNGKQFERKLSNGDTTLGRNKDNDIVIEDGTISRQHCRFIVSDGKLFIEPWVNRNPIEIQGKPISGKVQLTAGSEVQLADKITVRVKSG